MIPFPETFERTGAIYSQPDSSPRFAAYRGDNRLSHQPQQIRRDCAGEDIVRYTARGAQFNVSILRKEEQRRKTCWGYRYLITVDHASWKAFRTKAGFRRFLRAYNGAYTHIRHNESFGWGAITFGDVDQWQPLECRPIPTDDPHGYHNS